MKTENEEKPILPEELSHLEEPLKEAKTKIEAIDTKINNTLPDKGFQPAYRPPFYGSPQYGRYPDISQGNDSKIAEWKKEKAQIKDDFFRKLDKELGNIDPDKVKKVKEVVDYQLGDNKYKTDIEKEGKKQKGEPFGRIENIYYERYSFDRKKNVETPNKSEATKSDAQTRSSSKEQIQQDSPKYRSFNENAKDTTEKGKDVGQGINQTKIEASQAKNTPEKFMAQYELPKAKDFSENTKDMTDRQKANEPNKSEIAKPEDQSKNTPESYMSQYDYTQVNDFSENVKDITDKDRD